MVERLRTAPGVGPLTGLACIATLDEVERFEARLGMAPWSWTRSAGRGRVGDRQGEPPRKAAGAASTVTVPQTICTRKENAMPMHKPHSAFHWLDLDQGWATPVSYPSGIQQQILASDIDERPKMGSRSRRLRFEPGVYTTAPFIHDHYEEVYLQ